MKVLFVCTGNTCRSPMAQALAERMARERNLDLEVLSAGLFAVPGAPLSHHSAQVLKKDYGISFTHKALPLTRELFDEADLVMGMTPDHERLLGERFGNREKIRSLPLPVGDPYGGDEEAYRRAASAIALGLERLLEEGAFR